MIASMSTAQRLRFWSNVSRRGVDECWEWSRLRSWDGYGRLAVRILGKRRDLLAHRVAFILSGGELADAAPCVLHSCHNPACCNPNHLRAGTQAENMAEKSALGRTRGGDGGTLSAIAQQQARALREHGFSVAAVSQRLGVHPATVRKYAPERGKRLPPGAVVDIRYRRNVLDESTRAIASRYGITHSTVHRVASGLSYPGLPGPVSASLT